MNGWAAIVICVLIICGTIIVRTILEGAAKVSETKERGEFFPEPPSSKAFREHVRELDRTLSALLIANPLLLDSLPDENAMKRVLRGRRP